MSTQRAGPELPPHLLAMRKRKAAEAAAQNKPETLPSTTSPSPVVAAVSPESPGKRRRIVGPAPPPAPLDERPATGPITNAQDDDSSDDEFGPSLPGQAGVSQDAGRSAFDDIPSTDVEEAKPSRRDDWMTMPPKQDDLSARMDPTKIRARGFNSGKGAQGSKTSGPDTLWTETPKQKRKRLQDEVLGISQPATKGGDIGPSAVDAKTAAENEEKAKKIREYNAKHRSQSLYDQHQGTTKKEKEDDASKRAWDYEKDMAAGSKIGHAQKRELLNKASDFSSRFSSGKYL